MSPVHYCPTRMSLLRLCATAFGAVGGEKLDLLAALPEQIGGVTRQRQKVDQRAPDGQSATRAALIGALSVGGEGLMSNMPTTLGSPTRRSGGLLWGRRLPPVEEALE